MLKCGHTSEDHLSKGRQRTVRCRGTFTEYSQLQLSLPTDKKSAKSQGIKDDRAASHFTYKGEEGGELGRQLAVHHHGDRVVPMVNGDDERTKNRREERGKRQDEK